MTFPSMVAYLCDRALLPVAWHLHNTKTQRVGIRRTMRLAKRYNLFRHGRYHEYRHREYDKSF